MLGNLLDLIKSTKLNASGDDDPIGTCPQCIHAKSPSINNCNHSWHTWESNYAEAIHLYRKDDITRSRKAFNILIATIQQSDPKIWKRRFPAFHYYTRILQERFPLHYEEIDLKNVKDIAKNRNEPWHFRMKAGHVAALMYMNRNEVERGVKNYQSFRHVIKIAAMSARIQLANLSGPLQESISRLLNVDASSSVGPDQPNKLRKNAMNSKFIPTLVCAGGGVARFIRSEGAMASETRDVNLKLCARCCIGRKRGIEILVGRWEISGNDFVELFGLVKKCELDGAYGMVKEIVKKDDGTTQFVVFLMSTGGKLCSKYPRVVRHDNVLLGAENMRMAFSDEGEILQ
ncbi:hypothetical protein HDU76_005467 [Blyttiomyces sp. JEL0837]|nr:hypothetical protein HDU76_005467 [Blyttiomyces sp. JEL0837]